MWQLKKLESKAGRERNRPTVGLVLVLKKEVWFDMMMDVGQFEHFGEERFRAFMGILCMLFKSGPVMFS